MEHKSGSAKLESRFRLPELGLLFSLVDPGCMPKAGQWCRTYGIFVGGREEGESETTGGWGTLMTVPYVSLTHHCGTGPRFDFSFQQKFLQNMKYDAYASIKCINGKIYRVTYTTDFRKFSPF